MKKLLRYCLWLVPLCAFSGCQTAPAASFAGTWQGKARQAGASALTKYEFRPDGGETLTVVAGKYTMIVNGTYTIKDKTLTQVFTKAIENGKPLVLDAKKKAPIVAPFTLDGDTLTLTRPQATLHRVKSP